MSKNPTEYMELLSYKINLTQSVKFFLFMVFFLLILSVTLIDPFISYLLIPLYFFLLFMRIRIKNFQDAKKISIERVFSRTRVAEEDEIEVSLIISNNSVNNTQLLEIVDTIPSSFEITHGTNMFLIDLYKMENTTLQYKIKAKEIGIFEFGKINVRHSEFFGFIISTSSFLLTKTESLTVTPKFERFEKLPIYAYWFKFFNGYFVSKQYGYDSDFRGIKEYEIGDNIRFINWKASSRYQKTLTANLYSNIFTFESAVECEIVFDLTFESFLVHTEIMRLVASLIEFLLRTRNKVGFTIFKEYPDRIKSKIGTRQLKLIIDKLLTNNPDARENSSIMVERALNLSKSFGKKSIIFIISPMSNDNIINYCLEMKKNNFNLFVIQPNAGAKQLDYIKIDKKLHSLSNEIPLFTHLVTFDLYIQNQYVKSKMVNEGISLTLWNVKSPIKRIFDKHRITNN